MEKTMAFENHKNLKREISSKTVGENLLQNFPPPIIWDEQLNKAYQQAMTLLQKLSAYYQNNVPNFNNLLLTKALIPDHKSKLQKKLIPIELKNNLGSIDKISEFNLSLLNLDSESLGIPETEFTSMVTMPSNEFGRICR